MMNFYFAFLKKYLDRVENVIFNCFLFGPCILSLLLKGYEYDVSYQRCINRQYIIEVPRMTGYENVLRSLLEALTIHALEMYIHEEKNNLFCLLIYAHNVRAGIFSTNKDRHFLISTDI